MNRAKLCCRYKAASIDVIKRSAKTCLSCPFQRAFRKFVSNSAAACFAKNSVAKSLSLHFAHGTGHFNLIGPYQILVMVQARYTDVPRPSRLKVWPARLVVTDIASL